ncbi:hypothetical protein ACP70R_047833 [Stipagrostis hirtigluma subsp. patula]
MGRSNSVVSSPPLAVLLLLLLVVCFFHLATAARVLPPAATAVPRLHHQDAAESDAVAGTADGLVLQETGDGSNGDEVSEMTGAEEEEACRLEGIDGDECVQRGSICLKRPL